MASDDLKDNDAETSDTPKGRPADPTVLPDNGRHGAPSSTDSKPVHRNLGGRPADVERPLPNDVKHHPDSKHPDGKNGSLFHRFAAFVESRHPVRLTVAGYASYILIGWVFLQLPISVRNGGASLLDHLFVATSAVSTTGLSPVSTSGTYTYFGQFVVLILMQLGGIGYMSLSSFIILATRRDLSEMQMGISQVCFTLPENFDHKAFLRNVVIFTVVVETIGAFALSILFADAGVDNPLWQGTFHAVSAFCTAGFSLFDTSLEAFRDNVPINLTISLLSTLGALGFIVVTDVVHVIQRKRERMTLTSRIILSAAGIILTVTTVLLYLEEPSMQNLEPGPRLLTAFFQAMTSMTTVGFDTHPMSALGMASVTLLLLVMVVGAGPSGTGGGLKTTTFSAMFGTMRAAIRGRNEVTFWKNSIPPHRVMSAAATVSYYITTLAVAMFVISLLEHIDFEDLLFEVVSALGTVGLSRGITADLSDAGKIVICAVMFMGRLGPLTVGLALFVKNDPAKLFRLRIEESEEDLAL